MSRWFLENALLLNSTKAEAAICGTQQQLRQTDNSSGVDVVGTDMSFADSVKVLSVTMDSSLTFDTHVANIVHACNF